MEMETLVAFLVLSSLAIVHGSLLEMCCSLGEAWSEGRQRCSRHPAPIAQVPSEQQGICLSTIHICCVRMHREVECELGKMAAWGGSDCSTSREVDQAAFKDCCEACKVGILSAMTTKTCDFEPFSFGPPWDVVHRNCCVNVIEASASDNRQKIEITDLSSENLCESVAGLCAHLCVATRGSFRCECRPGFTLLPDGKSCALDVLPDRCGSDGRGPCAHKCRDTGVAIECSCHTGYQLGPDKKSCSDVDECELEIHDCDPDFQTCENDVGGYVCVNVDGPSQQGNPSADRCPVGYRFDAHSHVCDDVDECVDSVSACGNSSICENTIGSYLCLQNQCPAGYTLNESGTNCVDIDECKAGLHTCGDDKQICINTAGNYTCSTTCSAGYKYNKKTAVCDDINECEENIHVCNDASEECVNAPGGYRCVQHQLTTTTSILTCDPGYKLNRSTNTCQDVNECQVGLHNCLPSQRCDNTLGSYHCIRTTGCGTGYTLNAETSQCEDDDECVLGTDNCRFLGPVWQCRNTLGSFRCERKRCSDNERLMSTGECVPILCPPGYEPRNDGNCADVNECLQRKPCKPNQRCVNHVGSFMCVDLRSCGEGYKLTEAGTQCVDVDECASGDRRCGPEQSCRNVEGGFLCECPQGFASTPAYAPGHCEDVDECLRNPQICPGYSECVNTPGSFRCDCKNGFRKDIGSMGCVDVDECRETVGICQQKCINVVGSFKCACDVGYVRGTNNRTCDDINECEMLKGQKLCVGTCVNVPGSYSCRCPPGYRLGQDGRSCQDIDECINNVCPSTDVCLNTRGRFHCNSIKCPAKFVRDPDHRNRCKRTSYTCDENDAECWKMPLSYSFNYITFVSNMPVPLGSVDIFAMRGVYSASYVNFRLELTDARAPPGVQVASGEHFRLKRASVNKGVIALTRSIQGPQQVDLQLTMEIRQNGVPAASVVANVFIFVSEYEF